MRSEADSDDEAPVIYRRIRDEIRAFVEMLPDWLEEPTSASG